MLSSSLRVEGELRLSKLSIYVSENIEAPSSNGLQLQVVVASSSDSQFLLEVKSA